MPSVAIFGAGPLGGALAQALAERDRIARVLLVDEAPGVAAGKALDLRQAGAPGGFRPAIEGTRDAADVGEAAVLVLADPAAGAPRPIDAQAALLRRIAARYPHAPIVLPGPDAAEAIELLAGREIRRARLIGTAPLAFAAAVRVLVARELDATPAEVSLAVFGRPPGHAVVGWQAASVAGDPVVERLPPPRASRLNARFPALWPPGPISLAAAATRVVEALACRGRRRWCCWVAVDGERGTRAIALPVDLGPAGVEAIVEPALSPQERLLLENARQG